MPRSEFAEILGKLDTIRKGWEAADLKVQNWQKEIKTGDYFHQLTPNGLNIYGEVLYEYKSGGLINLRICRCYSIDCPEGENREIHVSTITHQVSKGEFENAREKLQETPRKSGIHKTLMPISPKTEDLALTFWEFPRR